MTAPLCVVCVKCLEKRSDVCSNTSYYVFTECVCVSLRSILRMIYKCVMCDTVFTQKPLLYVHFDTHLAKQKVHMFKCPDCTKLYAQKASMMEHMKVCSSLSWLSSLDIVFDGFKETYWEMNLCVSLMCL